MMIENNLTVFSLGLKEVLKPHYVWKVPDLISYFFPELLLSLQNISLSMCCCIGSSEHIVQSQTKLSG